MRQAVTHIHMLSLLSGQNTEKKEESGTSLSLCYLPVIRVMAYIFAWKKSLCCRLSEFMGVAGEMEERRKVKA